MNNHNTLPAANEEEQKQPEKKTEVLKQAVEISRQNLVEAKKNLEQQRGGILHRKAMKDAIDALNGANDEMVKVETLYRAESMKADIEKIKQLSAEQGESPEITRQKIAALIASEAVNSLHETNVKTSESLQEEQEKRSWFKRTGAKVGSWFSKGKKGSKWAKQGGAGFAAGTLTVVSGAAWPITTAVSLGAGALMGEAVRQGQLDENAKSERMSEDSRADMKNYIANKLAATTDDAKEQIKQAFDFVGHQSSADSKERNEKINKEKRRAMGRFAIGLAAGSAVTGGLVHAFSGNENVAGATSGIADKFPPPQAPEGAGSAVSGVLDQVGNVVTLDATANTPWDAVMQVTGDPAVTADKLMEAVSNTPGAQWHSLGPNGLPDVSSWISVGDSSVSSDVIKALGQHIKL